MSSPLWGSTTKLDVVQSGCLGDMNPSFQTPSTSIPASAGCTEPLYHWAPVAVRRGNHPVNASETALPEGFDPVAAGVIFE
jgi:hypothetical protein